MYRHKFKAEHPVLSVEVLHLVAETGLLADDILSEVYETGCFIFKTPPLIS